MIAGTREAGVVQPDSVSIFGFAYCSMESQFRSKERGVAFTIKKRGKLTYYAEGERPVLSSLVTEELPDGDLKIAFAGLTGGYSAKNILGLDELVTMDPAREIPLVFACWERWLQEAGICESLRDVDFIEIRAFGCQPKSPHPIAVTGKGRTGTSCRGPLHS